jgi:hypothetical protein
MMDNQQVSWNSIGLRMVQGLTTTIDAVRQLDVQEASLVMRLLGKSCTRMIKEGVGHQFGIALIETSAQLAMKESLVLEDVLFYCKYRGRTTICCSTRRNSKELPDNLTRIKYS